MVKEDINIIVKLIIYFDFVPFPSIFFRFSSIWSYFRISLHFPLIYKIYKIEYTFFVLWTVKLNLHTHTQHVYSSSCGGEQTQGTARGSKSTCKISENSVWEQAPKTAGTDRTTKLNDIIVGNKNFVDKYLQKFISPYLSVLLFLKF